MPQGLAYVTWDVGVPEFEEVSLEVTIHEDLSGLPGIYLQMYEGEIGATHFYFGLQTSNGPEGGERGKALVFSRWQTRDLDCVRATADGWTESADYEDDFVSVRRAYAWTDHAYRFRLKAIDEDDQGVWYGFFVLDRSTGTEDYAGAIRFPPENGERPRIKDGGASWVEVYDGADGPGDVPAWHVSIEGLTVDDGTPARGATSEYADEAECSDVSYDAETASIHLRIGCERKRDAGVMFGDP